jgi:hypothetical protein
MIATAEAVFVVYSHQILPMINPAVAMETVVFVMNTHPINTAVLAIYPDIVIAIVVAVGPDVARVNTRPMTIQ